MDRLPDRPWIGSESVPRTRGDGPLITSMARHSTRRVPRTRGDGPRSYKIEGAGVTSVPRTRGDGPAQRGWPSMSSLVFPAHAGMDRGGRHRHATGHWVFPAHAGMDRTPPGSIAPVPVCSPHTRGWTGAQEGSPHVPSRVPRTRGDGPSKGLPAPSPFSCSPHTRGWTEPPPGVESEEPPCSPHTRGWTGTCVCQDRDRVKCSPHTRGWTEIYEIMKPQRIVFPAHAGMDRVGGDNGLLLYRVPRTRGDGPIC